MPDNRFRARYGPWAVVAGASAGLGAAFAGRLASHGLNLVLVARGRPALQALAARLEAQHAVAVQTVSLDLAQSGSVSALVAHTQALEVGLLVYNAAFSSIGPFLDRPLADHLRESATNCRTPLQLAYHFGQSMRARGRGGLVLMSSLSALHGSALIANYAATKAYNLILAEGLWEELRTQGVDVLACCAGATSTPNYLASLSGRGRRPPGPVMSPEAVAAQALAALGRQPSLIPGQRNRLASMVMDRLLPRSLAVRLMGRVLRSLYAQ